MRKRCQLINVDVVAFQGDKLEKITLSSANSFCFSYFFSQLTGRSCYALQGRGQFFNKLTQQVAGEKSREDAGDCGVVSGT